MNEQFNRQATELINAAMTGKLPNEIGSIAIDNLTKAQSALVKINDASKEGLKIFETLTSTAYMSAKLIAEKALDNAENNVRAAVDAVRDVTNAKTINDVAGVQAAFIQKQLEVFVAQAQELLELSSRAAQDNLNSVNAATRQGLANLKVA